MWIPARYQELGKLDIHALTSELLKQPQELWDADEHLKHKIANNRQAQALYLQVMTAQEFVEIIRQRSLTQADVLRYSAWEPLQEVVRPIVDLAVSHFSPGGIVLCIQFARMQPGAKIPEHTDSSPLLASSYRLHVPIVTHDDIHFYIDGERVKMLPGYLYCLNNRVPHWVENRSSIARTHLIIDYLPPENNGPHILNENVDLMLKARNAALQHSTLPAPRTDIALPKVIATSVIRGANKNESHGGVYLVDMQNGEVEQVVDWNTCDIDFSGRGWDRGLRGIAFHQERIYIAAGNEIFCFDRQFNIVGSFRNPYMQHVHEIVIDSGKLYITSTGYDSILRFDLATNTFDHGWLLRISRNGRREFDQYRPVEPYGPTAGNTLHINSVSHDKNGLYVSGRNTSSLFRISDDRIDTVCELPRGTHNAIKYNQGYLFNDTESNQLVQVSTYTYSAIDVPGYPPEDLLHAELGDESIARQSFARGLCTYHDGVVLAGSSPSTVSAYDLVAQQRIKSVNISMDIRNAIHGLEIWPY